MADNKKYISILQYGENSYYIKDSEARGSIEEIESRITGGMHYLGKSSTKIEDGDAIGPWTIDSVVYVSSGATGSQKNLAAGDIAIYGELEFIWSGAAGKWQEFGSTGSLKALAFKDSASGSYTPAGTNAASVVSFTGTTDGDFVTGFDDAAVLPSFTEGTFSAGSLPSFTEGTFSAGTLPSFTEGAFDAGSLPSFTEGQFTPAEIQNGFVSAGSAASFTEGAFSAGSLPSLGAATTSNFATEGVTVSIADNSETLVFTSASTSSAVTAQGTFDAGSLPSKAADTFVANVPTAVDVTKFSGGSKAADTFSAGSLPSKASDTWSAGTLPSKAADTWDAGSLPSKDADTFDAGSAATLATAKAITDLGTAEAAAQTFTGTAATITVS